jgi:hypothetical protein
MRITRKTWQEFIVRYGDFDARRRLRWITRQEKECAKAGVERARKDFDVLWALIHTWPQGTAAQNRKKFAAVIRSVLTNIREHRERINGFCAPGVPTARLP